jgi:hypothetical protein
VAAVAVAHGIAEETTTMNRTLISLRGLRALALALACTAGTVIAATAAPAQQAFPSPAAAADAFVDAVARHDEDALKLVVGPDYATYLPHADAEDVTNFLEAWAASHRIVAAGADKAYVEVGTHGWTMPIPIIREGGGWRFDTRSTPEELRLRRIGRNELAVIQVMLAYADAQDDYAKFDLDRNGQRDFAQRLLSTPGMHDGLYWETRVGEPESPLGSAVAQLQPDQSYHGYHFRILKAQGSNAPGGAKDYVVNGRMTGGYALVAWPAKWGDTGVMSFLVSQDRVVYEKDLGRSSAAVARAMTSFNPDTSWAKVPLK